MRTSENISNKIIVWRPSRTCIPSDFSRRANVEEIDANRGKSESGNESTSASAVFLAIDRFRIENNTQFVRASFFSPPSFLSTVGMYLYVLFLSFFLFFLLSLGNISRWFSLSLSLSLARVIFRMGKKVDSNSIGQDADRSRVIFLLNRLQTLYL